MNYWHILEEARAALAAGRYRDAEEAHDAALAARTRSPLRVLLTERSLDTARRLAVAARRGGGEADAGRWERAAEAFRNDFAGRAEAAVALALRAADLRPEDDPERNQPLLAAGLYLVIASRLAPHTPAAAVPLVKALLRTARHTGKPFDRELIRADLPLTPEDRLWLARTGDEVLVNAPAGAAHERFAPAAWAQTLLALLDPAYFPADAYEDDRRWVIATLCDHHLDDPHEILARYADCLARATLGPERVTAARTRCGEMLGNVSGAWFPVPRHDEARAVLAAADAPAGTAAAERLAEARAVLEYRRPVGEAWASATSAPDGRVQIVLWWGECPRDAATWHDGDDPQPLRAFLEPARGRVLWAEPAPPGFLVALGSQPVGQALAPLVSVLLDGRRPAEPVMAPTSWRLALANSGPWRDRWRVGRGHPLLAPPGADGLLAREQTAVAPALAAGLLWLACLRRIDEADPALRAGLGELGRRGDAAAAFIHGCAVLDSPAKKTLDANFAAWTLPLLWTRPDPLPADVGRRAEEKRADLAGNDVVVVVTGRPGRALAAWGGRDRRWRVVLDRIERAAELGEIARDAYGPVTLVPAGGGVHHLGAALAWLDELARTPREGDAALLAVVHWMRLVESHNGDLLDTRRLRPTGRGAHPVLDLYAEAVASLPREAPALAADAADSGWGAQFAQRVRKSGLVAGAIDDLPVEAAALDAIWGVFEGSDASWVFLDSAAVHWQLWRRDPGLPAHLHGLLVARGRRHASLVTGGGALAADLVACLGGLLAPYGRPYVVDLGDHAAPRLRLAARGPAPGARLLATESWCAPLQHLGAASPGLTTRVLAGPDRVGGDFWAWAERTHAAGAWSVVGATRDLDFSAGARTRLVVPRLGCLDDAVAAPAVATAATAAAWQAADAGRREAGRRAQLLASLEINALLAAPVAVVEVLDGRWWRRFATGSGDPAAAVVPFGAATELVDLPAGDAGALKTAVAEWLASRANAAPAIELPLPDGGGVDDPAPGVQLRPGDGAAAWQELARWLLRAWEAGEPIGRLFLLGESPPVGAAEMVAIMGCPWPAAPGEARGGPHDATTAAAVSRDGGQGPLRWLRPRDVARIGRGEATTSAPDVVLVCDFARWIPDAGEQTTMRFDDDTAHALRWIAGCGARWVILAGADLSPAWAQFLCARLGASAPPPSSHPGGWPELRRGDALRPACTCPHCGQRGLAAADLVCAACGYDLAADAAWRSPLPAAESLTEAMRDLARQRDLGRDQPLEIWSRATITPERLTAAGVVAVAAADGGDTWILADGRRWRRQDPAAGNTAARGAPVARIGVPPAPASFAPLAPAGGRTPLLLLYADAELGEVPGDDEVVATRRLLRLLRDHADVLVAAERDVWPLGLRGEAVLPLPRIARLCGLAPPDVARALATLRWTARLAGVGRVATTPEAPGPRLLVRRPFAGIEHDLRELRRDLPVAMRALGAADAGVWREAVLQPAMDEAGSARRTRVDVFLHLAAHVPLTGARRLAYPIGGGSHFSDRRWFLWLGPPADVPAWCEEQLAAFADAARALLARAVPIDAGYLIAPEPPGDAAGGLPAAWPADVVIWGQELGYWHAVGVQHPWQVPLAELDRLRDPAVSGAPAAGALLLRELARERAQWRRALATTLPDHAVATLAATVDAEDDESPAVGTRRGWRRRGADHDPFANAVQAVAAQASAPSPGVLALSGHAGTGRHEALLTGLEAAARTADGPDDITVWCPDSATAARLHLAALQRRPGWRLDLRVAGAVGEPGLEACDRAAGGRRVVVLAELQRFPRELRYQLLDHAAHDRLLVTIDPGENQESWENLFITAPRADDVRTLDVQRVQARRLWEEVAPLVDVREIRAPRRDRGDLDSRRVTNLAECVSAIASDVAAGRIASSLDVVSPLAVDVHDLANGLRERDWLAVSRRELDEYLLPGVLDLLAAAHDVVVSQDGPRRPALLLPASLPAALAEPYQAWLHHLAAAPPATIGELWERWRRTPWGRAGAGGVAAGARAGAFARAWSEVALASLLDQPLVVAWRDRLGEFLARDDLRSPHPVARFATADQAAGAPVRTLVYVCAGTEDRAVHYRAMGRVADQLLVLWHEQSPLASEARGG